MVVEREQPDRFIALVVDDDLSLRFLLRRLIEREGGSVVEAVDGLQALEMYARHQPDIVLMDVMMPSMDGIEACSRLRALPGGENVPIMLITALDDQQSIDNGFAAGATDYIPKPLPLVVLRHRVRRLVRARKAEAALHDSEVRFRSVAQTASDAILLFDAAGVILFSNHAAERIFGYSDAELDGRNVEQLMPEDTRPLHRTRLPEILEIGDPRIIGRPLEVTGVRKGGETIPVELTLSRTNLGNRWVCTSIIRDISERKRMQEQIIDAQKLAGLGTLAAGVAHELNSPLQVITGMSESLLNRVHQDGTDTERLCRGLDVIKRNGWRCAEIVRSLLTYARPSTGQTQCHDLSDLVRDSLLLIEHQLRSWSNITVTTELASDLPPFRCDRNQLTQVLINLLTNARDAMVDGGGIVIRTGYDVPSSRLMLEVSDTGPGIPPAIRDRIFDPFFTTKPLGQGTGLGLSLVVGIVRAYGGEIVVESTPGRGATFRIFFPLVAENLPTALADLNAPGRFSEATPLSASVNGGQPSPGSQVISMEVSRA